MAGAAVRGTINQERAAIPLDRLVRIDGVFAWLEVEGVPHPHRHPDVERKWERIGDHRVVHGGHSVEIGPYRKNIRARHLRVGVVRHRGIEPFAVSSNALAHGFVELIVRPRAYPRLHVRRDVRRNDVSERRFDRPAAGERLVLLRNGVTTRAIRQNRQVSSPVDGREILRIDLAGRRRPLPGGQRN